MVLESITDVAYLMMHTFTFSNFLCSTIIMLTVIYRNIILMKETRYKISGNNKFSKLNNHKNEIN